jgi:hypothetical protein
MAEISANRYIASRNLLDTYMCLKAVAVPHFAHAVATCVMRAVFLMNSTYIKLPHTAGTTRH